MIKSIDSKCLLRSIVITSPIVLCAVISMTYSVISITDHVDAKTSTTHVVVNTTSGSNTPIILDASKLFTAYATNSSDANKNYLERDVVLSGKLISWQKQVDAVSASVGYYLFVGSDNPSDLFKIKCIVQIQILSDTQLNNVVGKDVTITGVCLGLVNNELVIANSFLKNAS
ncbi:hypothetical protein Dform_01994 [Dehalogenimonas formicexedens]|uniref:tRNA_anti-like n=3 Tax=Dehalococcoidaceae TaxID=1202464 RepID=A0A1P8FA44_9CHLR|nr:hypothetical protein Dform_01994 [Dehalogenimonas formicexedens]KTB49113.1 hypothetical protein DEALK_00240 [Dehalogenimonas alkenigignens]